MPRLPSSPAMHAMHGICGLQRLVTGRPRNAALPLHHRQRIDRFDPGTPGTRSVSGPRRVLTTKFMHVAQDPAGT